LYWNLRQTEKQAHFVAMKKDQSTSARTKEKGKGVKIYKWTKQHVDGKIDEKLLGAAHPGCCKQ